MGQPKHNIKRTIGSMTDFMLRESFADIVDICGVTLEGTCTHLQLHYMPSDADKARQELVECLRRWNSGRESYICFVVAEWNPEEDHYTWVFQAAAAAQLPALPLEHLLNAFPTT